MSVFKTEETQTEGVSQNTEQTTNESQPQDSYVQKLVEVKGENWKDPEVLAKGKLEADNYIKELETQLSQIREDVGKQDYAKELLTKLQERATSSANVNPEVTQKNKSGAPSEDNTPSSVSEETLKSLVEKTLTEREIQSTVTQNLRAVNQKMEESYGTEAEAHVKKKAEELGMSFDRLQDLAAESPNAFFTLIGEPQKVAQPIVQGSVRTEGVNMQRSTERNFDYYQRLRRENKSLYYTPRIQQQMFEDRIRLGDKFGTKS
mgnify:CR=1 FL=1|jgi:type IV secretory pathway VirJ component|tara:strand:- start:3284 stop:4069 length:786 start_codon:yes stop_codon:yes gene_type:complete